MTGNWSIKTEKLNDRHILVKEILPVSNSEKNEMTGIFCRKNFCRSTILKKLNDRHILLNEFLPISRTGKLMTGYFNNTEFLPFQKF